MPIYRLLSCVLVFTFLSVVTLAQDAVAPRNLGGGLRQLAQWQSTETAGLTPAERRQVVGRQLRVLRAGAQIDAENRVVVDAYLDGSASAAAVRARLEALGGVILNRGPLRRSASAPQGVFSVRLPVDRGAEAARLPGVRSVTLVHRPIRRVGKATSQGAGVIKSDVVNDLGYTGSGITVGVISDSYDATIPHAAADVIAKDLPGDGNPDHTQPVLVLEEGDLMDDTLSDEGRALLQVVHDVAPGARLVFAAVGNSQSSFADAIENLRTNPDAPCDVIVDDIGFPDEPFFSDGIVAVAAQDAVNSTTLAGRRVAFYSAAGNNGSLGYEADFSAVSDADVRAKKAGRNNLKFTKLTTDLTAGGWHNFTPGSATPTIVQRLDVEGDYTSLILQWNDLFVPQKITADYHLLVFDKAGNYIPSLSGIDNAFALGQAVQFAALYPTTRGKKVTYQIAIARSVGGTGTAKHLRYIAEVGGNLTGTFLQSNVPTTFGHSGARDVDGVAAYAYDALAQPEDFTSLGPVRIDFDDQGNRLTNPELRQQPTLAAPDGVDTSFFPPGEGNDTDDSGYPNFFGTSAAAPHAAGVAALLLQAAGGPGSKTAAQLRAILKSTAAAHDLDPGHAEASVTSSDGTVRITGDGDESNFSSANPNFFRIHYTGAAGTSLRNLTIDLSPSGLKFDGSRARGFPFTIGSLSGGAAKPVRAVLQRGQVAGSASAKLSLTFGNFPAGGTLTFGLDRDLALVPPSAGNSADLLAAAPVTILTRLTTPRATLNPGSGTFENQLGTGYSAASGFGLIDAEAAFHEIIP